mmetsp:Transcript_19012/g.46690  ORF Transcript_19012/g.46690 Transcript_19012/m.46690 type:complete len:426 (+) Transcript_19012:3246-4523(+)
MNNFFLQCVHLEVSKTYTYLPIMISHNNIGALGQVSHGKTSFIDKIATFSIKKLSEEEKKKISLRLSYSKCYTIKGRNQYLNQFFKRNTFNLIVYAFSLIDIPGHNILFSTLLTSSAIMDRSLLFIALNDCLPTNTLLKQFTISLILDTNIVRCVISKIDLEDSMQCIALMILILDNFFLFFKKTIKLILYTNKLKRTDISSYHKSINSNSKLRELNDKALLAVPMRLFKVFNNSSNRKGSKNITIGCFIFEGYIDKYQLIEIKPGLINYTNLSYQTVISKVSLIMESNLKLKKSIAGNVVTLTLTIKTIPQLSNLFKNATIGNIGELPDVYHTIKIKIKKYISIFNNSPNIKEFGQYQELLLHTGLLISKCRIIKINKNKISLKLFSPLCLKPQKRITLSVFSVSRWKLVAWGFFYSGITMQRT